MSDGTFDQITYPDAPGYKEPTTSRDAAEAIAPKAPRIQTLVLHTINRHAHGLTADECADALNMDRLTIRPRVAELHRLGVLERTGERRANRSGASAHVWRAATATRP